MKKFTFILAALFAATFANAQITLEHTFNNNIRLGSGLERIYSSALGSDDPVIGDYIYEETSTNINIYDATNYSLIKSIAKVANNNYAFISRGIFTTDNKWAYVEFEFVNWHVEPYCGNYAAKIKTEDGVVLASLTTNSMCENYFILIKIGDNYKLAVENGTDTSDIYSLPGNGEPSTDIVSPSTPKRSARKIAHGGHVLVETETSTYNLQGAEVK